MVTESGTITRTEYLSIYQQGTYRVPFSWPDFRHLSPLLPCTLISPVSIAFLTRMRRDKENEKQPGTYLGDGGHIFIYILYTPEAVTFPFPLLPATGLSKAQTIHHMHLWTRKEKKRKDRVRSGGDGSYTALKRKIDLLLIDSKKKDTRTKSATTELIMSN
jgi:hypothetical protein